MKMTLNIDEELLARVMADHGAKTKTDAIHLGLEELDRRAKLVRVLRESLEFARKHPDAEYDERSFAMADMPPVIIKKAGKNQKKRAK